MSVGLGLGLDFVRLFRFRILSFFFSFYYFVLVLFAFVVLGLVSSRDWLERTSPKLPILCRMGGKTNQIQSSHLP